MRTRSSSQIWGLVVLIWNIKWMYILLNDCDINILFGLSTRVICFCPYRAIFNLCAPLTQGIASLCPGLCAVCPFRAFPCSQEPGRFLAAKVLGVSFLSVTFGSGHFISSIAYRNSMREKYIKIPPCSIPPWGHLYIHPWHAHNREDWRK